MLTVNPDAAQVGFVRIMIPSPLWNSLAITGSTPVLVIPL